MSKQVEGRLSFGIEALDELLGGVVPGHTYCVSGVSGSGLSSVLWTAATSIASRGVPCAIVAGDTTAERVFKRFLAARTGREGRHTAAEILALGELPIAIDDDAPMSIGEIREWVEESAEEQLGAVGALFIDPVRLTVFADVDRGTNGWEPVSEGDAAVAVMGGLQAIATEFKIPVFYSSSWDGDLGGGFEAVEKGADVQLVLSARSVGDVALVSVSVERRGGIRVRMRGTGARQAQDALPFGQSGPYSDPAGVGAGFFWRYARRTEPEQGFGAGVVDGGRTPCLRTLAPRLSWGRQAPSEWVPGRVVASTSSRALAALGNGKNERCPDGLEVRCHG